MDERQKQILKDCESFGEDEVRRKLYSGEYPGARDRFLIEGWLHNKESEREQLLSTRREALEVKMLRLTKVAIAIAIIAIILAIIAAKSDIKWIISWLICKLTTS